MSLLLMQVSGVTLLEKDIGERRPGYEDYVRRTNSFFPGRPQLTAILSLGRWSSTRIYVQRTN
jgi:steroid 5-alpha reductase family enzyme